MQTMDPSTKKPTVCFGTMDPVDGSIADSTMLVVANSNMLVAIKQAVKIAQEKDWADVVVARTAASAAMLKTLKEKAPCWDDVVVSPLTTLPGENESSIFFPTGQAKAPHHYNQLAAWLLPWFPPLISSRCVPIT
jgi:hypothetical protein